jgi:hypothetical protein
MMAGTFTLIHSDAGRVFIVVFLLFPGTAGLRRVAGSAAIFRLHCASPA